MGLIMESVNLYLRRRSARSEFSRRRSWAVSAMLAGVVLLIVLLYACRAAFADGAGLAPSSIAPSAVSPPTQEPRGSTVGVYVGCQELVPSPELPQSGR